MSGTVTVSEATFQAQVIQIAHFHKWDVMHVRRSIGRRDGQRAHQTTTSIAGWPDLTMFSAHGGLLFAELKSETGKVTSEQAEVHASLRAAGQTVYVWRPSDLDDIAHLLSKRDRNNADLRMAQ